MKTLICADLSMHRPGFALLDYDEEKRTVQLRKISVVNNKNKHKPHGQIQNEIVEELCSYLKSKPNAILVRERGFSRFAAETQALYRVVGVADQYAWIIGNRVFKEISPAAVKKLLTGTGRATKNEVASALEKYVGKQQYDFDDMSDAVAVGVAWLLQNNKIDSKDG